MTAHHVRDFAGCVDALRQPDLRQSLYDAAAVLMSDVLVNLHGQEHRARRSVEAAMFRKDIFLDYERDVLPRTVDDTLAPYLAAGGGDLVDIGYRVMMNLTVDFAGIDRPLRSAEETGVLLALLRDFSLAPALGQSRDADVELKRQRIAQAMTDFDKRFLRPSVARRMALIADVRAGRIGRADFPKDVLTALLLARDTMQLSERVLLQEIVFFVLAGAHTTIHSLVHAFHELQHWMAAEPENQRRLADDPFLLQRCVFESLRLYPSSPIARRRAVCPVTLVDGTVIACDDEVTVGLSDANRDRVRFGGDAERFDPDRTIAPGTFPYGLSMGDGVHACLGRHLAVGVGPKAGANPATHQYGIVPLLLRSLLDRDARPRRDQPPERDEGVTRVSWARYPIVFGFEKVQA